MSEQGNRGQAVKELVIECTVFMKELTALVAACKIYVEKNGGKK